MSIALMASVWEMDLSPVDKLVMLAVADWANEDGKCWPSISKIATKSGCGERTVQRALREAEKSGHLTRDEVKGKGCVYTLHPRHTGTPATQAPVPDRRQTPATVAPNTPEIPQKVVSSETTKRTRKKPDPFVLPDWIPAEQWAGFVAMRKRQGKPLEDRALSLAITELRKLADAGYPPGAVLDQSTLKSWLGLFPIKDQQNGPSPRQPHGRPRDSGPDPILDALGRATREAEELERASADPAGRAGTGYALPAP